MWSMSRSTSGDEPLTGFVSLVGAGPGDPGLVTLKGLERIEHCEAVVHDRLVSLELVEKAPASAVRFDVGKQAGRPKYSQEEINRLLIEQARLGRRVVRLKGGDPGIFGRVGEEIAALVEAGIPFEIIPGVTAATAAAAAASIPLTHRDSSSSVTLVTAHEDPVKKDSHLNWPELAQAGTLVFYMIGRRLSEIADGLIGCGRSSETPAAIVREASHPTVSVIRTTLAELSESEERFEPGYPAVLIVGAVAGAASSQARTLPLTARTIVLTHPVESDDPLRRRLTEAGARVLLCPCISIEPTLQSEPVLSALKRLEEFDWVLFTSKNAVQAVRAAFEELGWDARRFGGVRIASVGRGTARVLEEWGIVPDLIPVTYTAEGLFAELAERDEVEGRRFFFPASEIARESLETSIHDSGGEVERVTAYRTVLSEDPWSPVDRSGEIRLDGVTFTSSSTVRGFKQRVGEEAFTRIFEKAVAYSIGPKTTQTLLESGVPQDRIVEAETSDFEGLASAVVGGPKTSQNPLPGRRAE